MKKSIINKWKRLEDCLHVIGCKCPIPPLNRGYAACTMCTLIATKYRLTEVFSRPIPEPEGMTTEEELAWFEIAVNRATAKYNE